MEAEIAAPLLAHGPLGILCVALVIALRTLWKRNDELWTRYDEVQKARLADRDVMTKALIESTSAIREMLEYASTRRRG